MADMTNTTVAYFSMEICLEQAIPTYSGGLGILSGDTLRSAADLSAPVVGVTLLHRAGYFRQHIDQNGNQTESPERWKPEEMLEPVDARATVVIEGRTVHVRAWRYTIRGVSGHQVPVYLLDTQLPENDEWDRTLTDELYGGDSRYRLCQEGVLGMGGAAILRSLNIDGGINYHLNEGHSALLTLCLLQWQLEERSGFTPEEDDLEQVRRRVIFTTHTPVPAGHDKFPLDMVKSVLARDRSRCCNRPICSTRRSST
jgi:alpha-glucan phosphorylases